jgi:hypothetical protein
MGFAAELNDFVKGFKGGYELASKTTDQTLKAEELEMKKEYYARDRRSEAQKDKDEAEAEYKRLHEGAKAHDVDAGVPKASYEAGAVPSFARLEQNITEQESGGNYAAIGPTHPKMGRALGYAQVMESNLPKWSEAAVGRVVSADEFLQSPDLQKKIVRHRLGGYYDQYGPEGAASMWFTGKPRPSGRRDSLGTKDYDYVRRATRMAGVDPDEQPVVYAASGGLIEDDYAGDDESGGSNPAVRDAVEGGEGSDDFDPMTLVRGGPDMADIVDDGVDGIQSRIAPAGQGVDPQRPQRLEAFARNIGAPSRQEVKQMEDTVDPKGKLSEGQRAIAAWKGMYDYHTRKGNAVGAQRAAMAMLMYTKAAATQGGTIAEAAFEKGDVKGGAEAIAQAYNTLPDGTRIEIGDKTKNGVKFKMYDETTGEVTQEGEAKMNQLVQMATGMRNGTEWFRAVGAMGTRKGDAVAKRQERERGAIEDFDATLTEKDRQGYIATLSDAQREAFLKMPRSAQHMKAREWERLEQEKRVAAGKSGTGGSSTAGERADRALEAERDARKAGVPLGMPEGEMGPSASQREGFEAVDAGVAFDRRANDPGRRFDKETATEVMTSVDAQLEKDIPVKLKGEIRNSVGDIANDIARVSDVLPDRAASIAVRAMKEGFQMGPGGSILVGNEPPVYMSQRSRLELARIRGALTTPKGTRDDAPTGQVSHGASDRPHILKRLATPPEEGLPLSRRGGNVRQTMSNMGRAPAALSVDPNDVVDTSKYDTDEKRRRREARGVNY